MELCPNCSIELIPNKKKLGSCSKWLICNKCGYRTTPTSNYTKIEEMIKFENYKARVNNNNLIDDE